MTFEPLVALAFDGFEAARQRHMDLRLSADPAALYISATECVYWASTLDEQLRRSWAGYDAFTSRLPVGGLLPGVRYVRNLKTHALPMTLRKVMGKIYPVVYPLAGAEVVWLPLEDLPAPGRTSKYTASQAAAYEERMAGLPTRHTFTQLSEGFARFPPLQPLG